MQQSAPPAGLVRFGCVPAAVMYTAISYDASTRIYTFAEHSSLSPLSIPNYDTQVGWIPRLDTWCHSG